MLLLKLYKIFKAQTIKQCIDRNKAGKDGEAEGIVLPGFWAQKLQQQQPDSLPPGNNPLKLILQNRGGNKERTSRQVRRPKQLHSKRQQQDRFKLTPSSSER